MEHFTGAAIQDQPAGQQWNVDPPFDARVRELVRAWGAEKSPQLIEEMIVTALKMARDQMSIADLKLINRSIKEMRYAAKVFAPFQRLRKVAIFGSARTSADSPEFKVAKELAKKHYQAEAGLQRIFRLTGSAEIEVRPVEPIKLLEVNTNTVPSGVLPVHFGPAPISGIPYPSVIVEVSPAEFDKIQAEELKLPNGWRLGEEMPKPPDSAGGA